MSLVSVYRGYAIHHVSVHPNWAARKHETPETEPFDLAATSFNEIREEIDAAVEKAVDEDEQSVRL